MLPANSNFDQTMTVSLTLRMGMMTATAFLTPRTTMMIMTEFLTTRTLRVGRVERTPRELKLNFRETQSRLVLQFYSA